MATIPGVIKTKVNISITEAELGGYLTSEIAGSFIANLSPQKHRFRFFLLEQFQHFLQGKRTADVGIEHEEPTRISLHDSIAKVVQTPSRSQCGVLAQIFNRKLRKLGRPLSKVRRKDRFLEITNYVDFFDRGDLRDCSQGVVDQGVASDFKERLKGFVRREIRIEGG